MPLIWDSNVQAFREAANVPMRYDATADAWTETTGMRWNPDVQAWEEVWSKLSDLPTLLGSGNTPQGQTGTATSESIDISKARSVSGTWECYWWENIGLVTNRQQGYGLILCDNKELFNTGICKYSNQDGGDNDHHYRTGTFCLDVSQYSSLSVRAVCTSTYHNWYTIFEISDLTWK